uniref:Protein kinase domain-containing protein n=1 Tax=Nelumbo nucifera TaxID=4432 RepID=A0A822XC47_NELNU|nr:TPA_asm: hypothetical protein HUJ06_019373 [Nelumbo nucifera]
MHVGDFGLAKFVIDGGASEYMSAIAGSYGYISCSWFHGSGSSTNPNMSPFGLNFANQDLTSQTESSDLSSSNPNPVQLNQFVLCQGWKPLTPAWCLFNTSIVKTRHPKFTSLMHLLAY